MQPQLSTQPHPGGGDRMSLGLRFTTCDVQCHGPGVSGDLATNPRDSSHAQPCPVPGAQ